MAELRAEDRRALTAGVLRMSKAIAVLASALVQKRWSVRTMSSGADWSGEEMWDGNAGADGLRFAIQRTLIASAEQSHGLAELARSTTEYTVALATLARGALEALGRAHWLLRSDSADQLLLRYGSLEYGDLRYPQRFEVLMQQRRARGVTTEVSVTEYRKRIADQLARVGVGQPVKARLTELTTELLGEIYNEPRELYSGLSAAAHGQSWAVANFIDLSQHKLQRDDQMVIEYCAYVTETTTFVGDRLIAVTEPDQASIDRWIAPRDQVASGLAAILRRRDRP